MDPKAQDSQNPDSKTPLNRQSHLPIIPFTSITLSIPKFIPIRFVSPPTISPKFPATLKIPTQIASIFNLSISTTPVPVTKSLLKSTVSANPLQGPLSLNPRRPSDPSNAAGLRRASVVWFRSDLRVHDNESLTSANNESISVLPRVKGIKVRNTIDVLDQLKGLPSGGNVDPGEIPSLADLGLNPNASKTQVKPVINGPVIGGETEALNRLERFATECQVQRPKETKNGNNDSIYGANFSCKIAPWLAIGSVSPRAVFDKFKKSTSRTISASSRGDDGDSGMNWLMYELLWRDFFRFITRKCNLSKQHNRTLVSRQHNNTPVPA
ncbi:hypothetical protein E3N88_45158 [Mikania micrantha]|uniref:Photolyase/cryptochrome alpha/beta domain-containing protein n=1 Tax=Mikania micrantha TaxID=192012 RepID=A0A5N6LA81_9ASTR|nr:hypothetical protein E3N88_45158 [Mikania micrantha]